METLFEKVIRLLNEAYEEQQKLLETHGLWVVEGHGFMWVKKGSTPFATPEEDTV